MAWYSVSGFGFQAQLISDVEFRPKFHGQDLVKRLICPAETHKIAGDAKGFTTIA